MSVFILESEGKHVSFTADTLDDTIIASYGAVIVLWNALHPEIVEQRVEAEKGRILREYGSAENFTNSIMRHIPPFFDDIN